MKRNVGLFCVLVMLGVILGGWSATAAPVKLTVWCWDANVGAIQKAADMYNADNGSDIVLNVVTIANDASRAKFVAMGESQEYSSLPDVALMEDTAVPQFVTTYPQMFVDLTDYGVNWENVVTAKRAQFTINGRSYAIPMDSGASIAMYRTDYLKKAGYAIADLTNITWPRAIQIGADVYKKTGKYLYVDNTFNEFTVKQIFTSAGGQFFDKKGNCTINSDIMVQAMGTLKALYDAKAIYIGGSWDEYIATLNNGTAAGVVNGNWINGNIAQQPTQKGLWAVTNMPLLNKVKGATHYTNSGGASWVVTTHAGANTKAAVDFLNYVFAGTDAQKYWADCVTYAGYVAPILPVLHSTLYSTINHPFYGTGFYSTVAACVPDAPPLNASPYYATAVDEMIKAAVTVTSGGDIDKALATALSDVRFTMK